MVSAIRRSVFSDSVKTGSAPHIFVILCVYTLISSVYTGLYFDVPAMFVRLALGLIVVALYVVIERSSLDGGVTAFLSPTLITLILTFGAVYFNGDFLLFLYSTSIAIISLSYLKPRSLVLYNIVTGAVFVIALLVFRINLLGAVFTPVYNILYFIVSVGMNSLVYIFCKSYVQALDTMERAKNEAARSAQAKSNFLANVSHEIRTPLNAIIGLTEAEIRRGLPQDDLDNLNKIHAAGNLLLGIVNEILDMSKIEAGKFSLVTSPYDFADMLYEVVSLNIVRIGSKPVKFNLIIDEGIPRRMEGDVMRVKQLLNNLLSNAFKYTNEGSVELKATHIKERGGITLVFTVSDTGIGIPEDELDRLFSEYAQINLQNMANTEGTGLGLAISKGLAELMGGRITAKSTFGEGSVFSAEIRQTAPDTVPLGTVTVQALSEFTYLPEDKGAEMEFTPYPHAKVLVVDDLDINLEVAAACMEPYEIQADCSVSGEDAVRRIKDGEPLYDLIFMDHMMPGMDGIEAARAIRALGTPYAKNVPIIALTANAIEGSSKMFAENGFQGFLSKPIEQKKLSELLRRWLAG